MSRENDKLQRVAGDAIERGRQKMATSVANEPEVSTEDLATGGAKPSAAQTMAEASQEMQQAVDTPRVTGYERVPAADAFDPIQLFDALPDL